MGIVAYYVHVDEAQLHALREQPQLVWNIASDPRFAKAAMMDVDKDWQVLSWLASARKRKEQQQFVASMNALRREGADDLGKEAFQKALDAERKKLGIEKEEDDPRSMPIDPLLEAIEGRGREDQRDPAFNFGLGAARLFGPPEVKVLAAAFSGTNEADIRANFNRQAMARFDVGGMAWLEESDSVLDEFLLPSFRRLSTFYQSAAKANHYVLVIYL
jgi:hypothetical protein